MKTIKVAVAVITNTKKQVLLALRQGHQHQGGLWEFPGGKVEAGESVLTALKRELAEEVAINVVEAEPLIVIEHDYGDRRVMLDVWHVGQFDGEAHGLEGQAIRWCAIDELDASDFPAANVPIITAIHNL